jgi:coenzyme F420-0:L-glutamate ligase/coenzyme F420-1:gamma-L-glutamate ligase
MREKIKIFGVEDIPLIKPSDNIPLIIFNGLTKNGISLEDGDIVIIAQTIISKSLGRLRNLEDIIPSQEAIDLHDMMAPLIRNNNLPDKSPELIQAILDESRQVLKAEHVMIVETNHGFICANAGIDKSNVGKGDEISLLPLDSDKEAEKIRISLQNLTKKKIAVLISDSFGRSFRLGAVGVALGVSGISSILDKRGSKDLYGKELQSTIVGQIDNLASAAQLVMGEADEGLPVVIIRGYKYSIMEKSSINKILRKSELDLFREKCIHGNFETILKSRRSYKSEFSDKEISIKMIEDCIDTARWAPSAHNDQYWRYTIIEKGKIRESLIKEMNSKLKEDLISEGKSDNYVFKKINKTRNQFLNSPYLILLCMDTHDLKDFSNNAQESNEYIMGVQSVSASATYLLLAFENKGLSACWYCAPLFAKKIIKVVLKLPNSFVPMAFFTVGYSTKTTQKPHRKELKDIIFKINKEE